jgi:type I restriction enzyme S subunit
MASDWQVATLGELVAFKTGKLDSNAAVPNGAYPFFTCSQETLRTGSYSFDTECVLLAGNNANGIFPLKYFRGKFDAYQRTYVVTPRDPDRLMTRFLYYALRPKLSEFRSVSTGAATKFLTLTILNQTEIQVPPLRVQRRIVGILSAYDDLIEHNLRRIKILDEMTRAFYREWFVEFRFPGNVEGFVGADGAPSGWRQDTLKDIAVLVMGQSPKSEFYNSEGRGLPFHQGVSNFGDYFPTDRTYCTVDDRLAEEDDILFSVRAPVGRINIAQRRMVIGRGLSAIRSLTGHQVFLLEQLRDLFKEEDSIGGGTIFKAVSKQDMENIKIMTPTETLREQFEAVARPAWKQMRVLTNIVTNLRSQRDLLLSRLISGQIEFGEAA